MVQLEKVFILPGYVQKLVISQLEGSLVGAIRA